MTTGDWERGLQNINSIYPFLRNTGTGGHLWQFKGNPVCNTQASRIPNTISLYLRHSLQNEPSIGQQHFEKATYMGRLYLGSPQPKLRTFQVPDLLKGFAFSQVSKTLFSSYTNLGLQCRKDPIDQSINPTPKARTPIKLRGCLLAFRQWLYCASSKKGAKFSMWKQKGRTGDLKSRASHRAHWSRSMETSFYVNGWNGGVTRSKIHGHSNCSAMQRGGCNSPAVSVEWPALFWQKRCAFLPPAVSDHTWRLLELKTRRRRGTAGRPARSALGCARPPLTRVMTDAVPLKSGVGQRRGILKTSKCLILAADPCLSTASERNDVKWPFLAACAVGLVPREQRWDSELVNCFDNK